MKNQKSQVLIIILQENVSIYEITGEYCKGNQEVHHLLSINTNPTKIYFEDNVIVLRKDIHQDFHNKYGRGNNTPSQFLEFKNNFVLAS